MSTLAHLRGEPPLAHPATIGAGDVLVLRALGLGDTVVAAAPLRGLRRRFPSQRLIIATSIELGAWLVREHLVDAVLPTTGLTGLPPLTGGHVAVNLHGRGPQSTAILEAGRPGTLVAYVPPHGPSDQPFVRERWRADEHEVDRWCRLVRSIGGGCGRDDLRLRPRSAPGIRQAPAGGATAFAHRPTVVLHPGADAGSRRWPAERWHEVARAIAETTASVEVTGTAPERPLTHAVAGGVHGAHDRGGRDDLFALADLVERADLVLCGDTGVAHLATAFGVPSVVLFGPVPPSRWGPAIDPDLHTVLWHGDPQASAWGDPHGDRIDARLEAITVDEVLAAVTSTARPPICRAEQLRKGPS